MHIETECNQVTTALLLAAGSGSRLRPLTENQPKCLTEVNGISILERLVYCLGQQGVGRLVVVVGHLEHRIREFLGEQRDGVSIEYVVNPQYRTTNNLYSLWLAREVIQEPFLLVESDVLFQPSLLADLLQPDRIAVSPMQLWMNGSTVTVDLFRSVRAFQLGEGHPTQELRYKTVNVCSLSLKSWRQIIRELERQVAEGRVNRFYESVFAEMVADGRLSFQAVLFDPGSWYEIDTPQDLDQAELLFAAGGTD